MKNQVKTEERRFSINVDEESHTAINVLCKALKLSQKELVARLLSIQPLTKQKQ